MVKARLLLSWKFSFTVKLTGLSDENDIYTFICFLVTPKLLPFGYLTFMSIDEYSWEIVCLRLMFS